MIRLSHGCPFAVTGQCQPNERLLVSCCHNVTRMFNSHTDKQDAKRNSILQDSAFKALSLYTEQGSVQDVTHSVGAKFIDKL